MTQSYMNSVFVSNSKPVISRSRFATPELLTTELAKKGISIKLGNALKGGTVSQVYEAELEGKRVVVKHTEDLNPFDPTEIFICKEGHNVDTKILQFLYDKKIVKVPQVYFHFPDITTTIMEDVRASGYKLQFEQLVEGKLDQKSATAIGESIANLVNGIKDLELTSVNETAEESIYERGLELRLSYPNTQEEYHYLENEFTGNCKYITCPDVHPKNVFTDPAGNTAFIDFGRSVYGDQRFILPNYLSHIAIYALCGYYRGNEAIKYIENAIGAYRSSLEIEEKFFCQYLGMEILHRVSGKWLGGISTRTQKFKLFEFGLTIFDDKITKISQLLKLLN